MNRYRELLAEPRFRRLWIGSTISALGDGATWVALSWLVYERTGSPTRVGLLLFAYGAPVIVGGLVAGPLLDRFGAVRVMQVDSLARGVIMLAIPILGAAATVPLWLAFAVAATYGLSKMVPLAGVPTLIAGGVRPGRLDTANALEALSYGMSGVVGPLLAAALISLVGAENVLVFDAASFFVFATCLVGLRDTRTRRATSPFGLRESLQFVLANAPIRVTTWMFASFNVGLGALLVLLPIYATTTLGGGATLYAVLTSTLLAGDLAGSFVVGSIGWCWPLGRSIAAAQTAVGVAFAPMLLEPGREATVALLFAAGVLMSPLTIWAQTLRMGMIPEALRGRVFSVLRTIMQAAEPAGGALGGLVIAGGGVVLAAAGIATVVGAPGLVGLGHPALAPGRAPRP